MFRVAVADQINGFKRRLFGQGKVVCPETGERLDYANCFIDHVASSGASFNDLKRGFLELKGLREQDIKAKQKKGSLFMDFEDKGLREEWREYHAQHAVLRGVNAKWSHGEGFRNRAKRK